MSSPTLDGFRDAFLQYGPPVVVFNKSHSGSRMLAQLLDGAGIAMGAHLNESWDSLDVLELVEYLVTRYYPDYSPLWRVDQPADRELQRLIGRVFERHLEGIAAGRRWGWKLCETVYILPVLDYCFPGAQFVHLIRDGRDVAFCDHKAPDSPLWRKIYFNTDRIRTQGGLRLSGPAYRRRSHLYNAIHWTNSVATGRAYGAMLRERYLEVRYEHLCRDLVGAATPVLEALGIADPAAAIDRLQPAVFTSSVGKFRRFPARWLKRVTAIEKPLLLELGYLAADTEPVAGWPWHSPWADAIIDRLRPRRPMPIRPAVRRDEAGA